MRCLFIVMIIGLLSCSTEPQPIVYGKDGCYNCKMTLMDKKFGAELVTKKGKVYKFDDVNCMIGFLQSRYVQEDEVKYKLVVDFANPEKLIDVNSAFFLKSEELKSPMNSEVAAFEKKEELELLKKELKGIYLVWGELVTQFK
jgi:copper chaperone NosL